MGRSTSKWYINHPVVKTRLPIGAKMRLEKLLRDRGQNTKEWIIAQIDRCQSERVPESQGDVKKIIPSDTAAAAREALDFMGAFYYDLFSKTSDAVEKRRLRLKLDFYQTHSEWFGTVLEDKRYREYLLESGQRSPRHRIKSVPNPEEESSS